MNASNAHDRDADRTDPDRPSPAPRTPAATRPRRARLRTAAVAAVAAGAVALGGLAVADRGDRTERVVERASDRLDLDDVQRDSLATLVETVAGLRGELAGDGTGEALLALVAGPTLDQAGALALIESRADAVRAAAPALVASAAAFYDGLDERQRERVDGLLERVGEGRGGRHR